VRGSDAPSAAPPVGQFAVQDQVTHDKYGLGRVIGVEDDTALVKPGCASGAGAVVEVGGKGGVAASFHLPAQRRVG
jgi:hypothetical protein